ncbi:MAG: AAA family ATPase, partial [Candidatus Thiodiazotropha sp.]
MSDAYDYFSTTEISARLDLVRHLIENSELVPLVRGSSGIGKTLLASRIQQLAPENWSVCHFEADPTMQPERLLATIARCCGLPDIAGELLQRLVDRFEVLRKRGRIPVLLVDDAQMLPPTSLITLLRLFERQLDGVRLVSIVLFADEQIDLLLSTPQLQIMSPQAIQVIDMPLLTRQETTAYMLFLLKNEGLSDQLALDEIKLNRIFRETKGNPGPMASAILNALGEDGDEKRGGFNLSGYRKQLLFGGVPLLLLVLLLLFLGPISSLFEPEPASSPKGYGEKEIAPLPAPAAITQQEVPPVEVAQREPATPGIPDAAVEERGEVGALVVEEPATTTDLSEQAFEEEGAAEDESPVATVERQESGPAIDDKPAAKEELVEEVVEEAAEDAEAEVVAPAPREVAAAVEVDDERQQPVSEKIEVAKAPEPMAVTQGEKTAGIESQSAEISVRRASPADVTETAATTDKPPEDASRVWVMSRSPNSYTLQL